MHIQTIPTISKWKMDSHHRLKAEAVEFLHSENELRAPISSRLRQPSENTTTLKGSDVEVWRIYGDREATVHRLIIQRWALQRIQIHNDDLRNVFVISRKRNLNTRAGMHKQHLRTLAIQGLKLTMKLTKAEQMMFSTPSRGKTLQRDLKTATM